MSDETTTTPSPEPAAPTIGQRRSIVQTGRQIRHGPLMPWMQAYAEWLCLECLELPKPASRQAGARRLAHSPVTLVQLKLLEEREDFVAYCDALRAGPLEQARARFVGAFPSYIAAHREALDLATSAGDYAAMARISEPVLDRVVPKKAEGGAMTSVTVVLAPEQVKAIATYEAPPMTVEASVVSIEPA